MCFFRKTRLKTITVYFGIPGSGKTTLAALHTKKALKHKEIVFSNVPIIGTYKYDPQKDLGKYQIEDCLMILDEAALEFNNRDFANFPKSAREFFKLHRHYGVAIEVYSQSFEDMDITIRRLATKFIVVRKSLIPFFITTRAARAIIDIDEQSRQFISGYDWAPLSRRWHFMPSAWPLFDSYDAPELDPRKWCKWKSTRAADHVDDSMFPINVNVAVKDSC